MRNQIAALLAAAVMGMAGFCAAASAGDPSGLTVLKAGDLVYARSAFSADYDVVISVTTGRNGQFDFHRAALAPTDAPLTPETCKKAELIHYGGDDSTPWFLNYTYIGANHGAYAVMKITSPGHGLAAADLGGEWLDEKGVKFYLVRILDADSLWLLSEPRGKGDIWQFHMQLAGKTLKDAAGGKALTVEKVVKTQLTPSCRITKQELLVDGKTPLVEGEPVSCKTLDVVEEYDIVSPASLLDLVRKQAGRETNFVDDRLDVVVGNRIRYQFQPRGVCLIRHNATAKQNFDLGYMGFLQSRPMVRLKEDALDYYIPNTLPFKAHERNYDFRAVQDFSERPPQSLTFSLAKGNVPSADRLPARFVQFLQRKKGGRLRFTAAYAFGYSLTQGMTRRAARAENCGEALVIARSAKSYPHAIDKKKKRRIQAGATFECVAYRQYFHPKAASAHATCVYWHREGDAYVLYADYHKPVDKDVMKLPKYLSGSAVTVVESTPSVTLASGVTVPGSGLALSVKGDYGYIVLRLGKKPSVEEVE